MYGKKKNRIMWVGMLLFVCILITSCTGKNNNTSASAEGDTIQLKYAQLLQMIRHRDYVEVKIINPWKKGETLHRYEIRKEFKRIVVYTAAHTRLLGELNAKDRIAGVCDRQYIMAEWASSLPDCGNAMNPNMEKMISLKPDAVILSPFENSGGYGKVEQLGIPVIEAADYMETTPLGRAEWMIFYGILVGKEKEASKLFREIEKKYLSLAEKQRQIKNRKKMMTDMKQSSAWYVPGGASYLGQMIADAGSDYAFAHDGKSGSIPVAFEMMLEKNRDADAWLIKYNMAEDLTLGNLSQDNEGYRWFKAFQNKKVYGCNTSYTPYFEEIPFHPEWLLEEIINILYGSNNTKLRYYKKLQ
ncbi:MAG: ABC transporter substrate-binding protein [Prevotella sp.]|nr:ABC transporter substrate-binding protein [Candidatus Equicola stercoris]